MVVMSLKGVWCAPFKNQGGKEQEEHGIGG